jgi:multidrug efflux pump subunit AcrB
MRPAELEATADRIRAALGQVAGARIELHEFENGPPVDAPLAMRLLGNDLPSLRQAAAQVETVFREELGTRDVRNPGADRRSDLRLHIDRDRAALLGVAVPDIDRAVRLVIGGVVAGSYHEAGADEARPIRLALRDSTVSRVGGGARPSINVLDHVYVANEHGQALPLAQLASLDLEPSPTAIRHYNRERSITVTTTLTALGGLIPLVLERSALYSPLAVVLVGGLVSSTILARIVTPVLYRLLPPPIEPEGLAEALTPLRSPVAA